MSVVEQLLKDIKIPRMYRIRQEFANDYIKDIEEAVTREIAGIEIGSRIKPGMRICLTCSSRGVDNLARVLKAAASYLISRGARPFIVPAMGSHGGATAEGQLEIAKSAGVTEDYCGCPIISCMDTVKIGTCEDGTDVFIDRHAAAADGIFVIGRVKLHTSFTGPYESGIMKMMAIGLGKQYGASVCHARGFGEMARMVPLFGKTILANANVIGALALVENAYGKTCIIRGLAKEEIPEEEPKLLEISKSLMPRIFFDDCDLLVVDYIGKNFSGDGMDPNITGRFSMPYKNTGGIRAKRVAVLDLSAETHNNAIGVGMADVCSRRIYEKMDFEMTYPNCITCKALKGGFVPLVLASDRLAMQCCLRTLVDSDEKNPKVIRIRNTLSLNQIEVSEAYLDEMGKIPNVTILEGPYELRFDKKGNLEDH